LPKKDAGAGLAFGGGTADALFGAGSGNALTKITKWGTVVFILLALFLGYFQDNLNRNNTDVEGFLKQVGQKQTQTTPANTPESMAPAPAPAARNPLAGISLGLTNSTAAPVSAPAK
jgi:preprotein translocase subunit SecG